MSLLGAIEAGGTKFVVAVADVNDPDTVIARESFPTLDGAGTWRKLSHSLINTRILRQLGLRPLDQLILTQTVAPMVMCWIRLSVVGQVMISWVP